MSDGGDLKGLLEAHFDRLEGVVDGIAKSTNAPRRFMLSDLTAIIAVLTLGVSVAQSWGVQAKRLDDIEKARATDAPILAKVPQLEWTLNQSLSVLERIEKKNDEQSSQIQEMRDALIKLGMQIPERAKR